MCVQKPLPASYEGGAIRDNRGYRDFKNFFTVEFTAISPPPKDSHFAYSKNPHWRPLGGGEPYVKIPGTGISKFFYCRVWSFFGDNFFNWRPNWGEPYVKIPGTGISNHGTGKKIPGAGISNPGTGKKIPGTGISNSSTKNRIERPYNRENFPGASRPSKTLTGILRDPQNWQSLEGGVC